VTAALVNASFAGGLSPFSRESSFGKSSMQTQITRIRRITRKDYVPGTPGLPLTVLTGR
jgi:hypothetical protein